ncbi:MAG: DNA mismatch repair endonuclease MutL [Candidatus Gastranaerophilales bacterium]|nr:DNA mismatch repair endonuclease MutL [Candidatus Gastranaerophilales bacterium]
MKRIKLLPDNLINQIAAGEVIERPASVVKEFLENSIDAGSNRIEIEIGNECRNIRVADNGHGIHKDDVVLAFSRHATSKLLKERDLWSISTLGFRGEALASIISVAKVSCLTRTEESSVGVKVECRNSEVKVSEAGCAIGTIMEVEDLFYNVPARMKFLRKTQTELASIIEVVQSIAISYPEVSVHLIHKGHTSLKSTGSGDLATVVSEIYSKELINELAEINMEDNEFALKAKGYASNPDFTRSNKKAVYLFVNGRTVKCHIISKAIDNAYKDLIPSGRYPFVVLDLNLPSSAVDVNVHPAKKEIRYINTNQVFNFVYTSIRSALEAGLFNKKEFAAEENTAHFAYNNQFKGEYSAPSGSYTPAFTVPAKVDFVNFKEKSEKSMDFYSSQEKLDLSTEENEIFVKKPKIIGQYLNTYILIETPEGLQVIDQHIAHERTIYEKLKESKVIASQLLLISGIIELEPSQTALFEENAEILSKYGYEFERSENKGIVLKQVPQMLLNSSHEKIVNEILEALESSLENIENKLLITTSCHAAVKAGEKLSVWQMEDLILEWQKSKNNLTCPHGRKICHILSSKEIASFFGRVDKN